MSFLDKFKKTIPPKNKNEDTYSGLRYPYAIGDMEPGIQSLLNFNIVDHVKQTYSRDKSSSFGKNTKYIKTVQLYMPALSETINNKYNEDVIGTTAAVMQGNDRVNATLMGAVGFVEEQFSRIAGASAAGARGSKSVANTTSVWYDGTSTRQLTVSYSFEPRSYEEVKNVNEIIQTFRKYALPSIRNDFSYFPKYWAIEEIEYDPSMRAGSEKRVTRMFKFGPAALLNVAVNLTPEEVWKTFHTGDPIQIKMDLTFQEIFILSQQDIDEGF